MRSHYIDNIRGIATISVIFIHTVFWSGMSYVPEYIRNISLFIDVPIFFLLTGFILRISNNFDPLKQIAKLIIPFTLLVCAYQLFFLDFNLEKILLSLSANAAILEKFPVVNGSYWFIPIYIVSLLIAHTLIRYYKKSAYLLITLSILYYIIEYFFGFSINIYLQGASIDTLLFFTSLIIIGFFFYEKNIIFLYSLGGGILAYIMLYIYDNSSFNLQSYKFPVGLPYVLASSISLFICLFLLYKENFLHKTQIPLVNYIGKHSIYFYMSQGISSSLIYYYTEAFNPFWLIKMIIAFSINLTLSCVISYIFIKIANVFTKNSFR